MQLCVCDLCSLQLSGTKQEIHSVMFKYTCSSIATQSIDSTQMIILSHSNPFISRGVDGTAPQTTISKMTVQLSQHASNHVNNFIAFGRAGFIVLLDCVMFLQYRTAANYLFLINLVIIFLIKQLIV